MSAFPVWGPAGIAFSHFPERRQPVRLRRARDLDDRPRRVEPQDRDRPRARLDHLLGFYGLQPLGWLDDSHLLIGLRGESGTEGAVLDIGSKKIRRLDERSPTRSRATGASRSAAAAQDALELSIMRLADGHRVFMRKNVCCPDWNR